MLYKLTMYTCVAAAPILVIGLIGVLMNVWGIDDTLPLTHTVQWW